MFNNIEQLEGPTINVLRDIGALSLFDILHRELTVGRGVDVLARKLRQVIDNQKKLDRKLNLLVSHLGIEFKTEPAKSEELVIKKIKK